MKTQAYGWLAVAVLAAGLNASYHDGGLQWAHQAIDGIGRNVGAVLALASGHADQFLAEAHLASGKNETATCRLATAWARIQTRMAQGQTRLAQMQTRFVRTGFSQAKFADRELALSHAAWDRFEARSEEMSARQEAAMAQMEAKRARMEAETERRLQERVAMVRVRPATMQITNWESGCHHVRVNVRVPQVHVPQVHVPQIHMPEINVPEVHILQIHIPDINVPSMSIDAGAGPV
jgi:hypothetical protein